MFQVLSFMFQEFDFHADNLVYLKTLKALNKKIWLKKSFRFLR